jgi:iron complex outermembrane recepter protein
MAFLNHSARVAALATACLWVGSAAAETAEVDMTEMSLEDLLNVELVSVSKRPQKVVDTAAAVFVITAEDIRRSGHTSVAEALRMVPGVNVGRPTPKSWSIGIRGDEFQFSRMLLVLVDGRAAYTTAFNGTFWDELDMPLDDVDRIEVIRGPGAAVWGANAVHGVINIIRKPPEERNNYVSVLGGNEDRLITDMGYTGKLGKAAWRVSSRYLNRDAFRARDDSTKQHDDYRNLFTSFRVDVPLRAGKRVSLQGDWYGGDRSGQFRRDLDATGFAPLRSFETHSVRGGNVMLNLEQPHSDTSTTELQLYFDQRYRDLLVVQDSRAIYDFELRNRFKLGASQLLNWGVGSRHVQERIANTLNFIATPEHQDEAIHNVFLQDEIELAEGMVRLTFGSKFEWNTYTGWEVQPTARFLWHVADHQQLWGSVSRAVRVPSRLDRGEYQVVAAYLFNQPVDFRGNEDFDSEVVMAYDLGYRYQPLPNLHFDLTGYTHRTQNFQVFTPASGLVSLSQVLRDSAERRAIGAEISVRWQPYEWLRLVGGWGHLHIVHSDAAYSPSGTDSAPVHELSLITYMDLPGNVSLDFSVKHHGRMLERFNTVFGDSFNGYTRHDLRLAWQPTENVELSLVGQNLFDRLHREGVDFFEGAQFTTGQPQSSVQRSWYAGVRLSF